MKINIFDSRIKKRDLNAIHLDETDFHPCAPFFKDHPAIVPENASLVAVKGLLEHSRYIRYILKMADAMLKVGGKLEIEFYMFSLDSGTSPFRNLSGLMYEISICFKERLKLVEKKTRGDAIILNFSKISATLPEGDKIDSWSFGIVSDGRKNDRILDIINQIKQFSIPNFEVVICGPPPAKDLPDYVKVVDDNDLYFDSRIPLAKKKNRIIDVAQYNNLILFHDRFNFPTDWYENIVKHGNYFDGFCIRIVDEDTKSHRVQDWISTSLNHLEFKKLFHKEGSLHYNKWLPNWNVNGGFMIIKRHLIDRVRLNPFLHWGEAEDGDLCRRLDADGFCLTLFTSTFVTTQTHRLTVGRKRKGIFRLAQKSKSRLYLVWNFYIRKKVFIKYLNKS
ncbi:hypothetical protein [Flavobacterium sp.]|jgi:hypothetical protein|uniref:hypothetical protein n=1 Tax=Flavobacterium sp. TaxID=239 RepID=UPI0037BECEC3